MLGYCHSLNLSLPFCFFQVVSKGFTSFFDKENGSITSAYQTIIFSIVTVVVVPCLQFSEALVFFFLVEVND